VKFDFTPASMWQLIDSARLHEAEGHFPDAAPHTAAGRMLRSMQQNALPDGQERALLLLIEAFHREFSRMVRELQRQLANAKPDEVNFDGLDSVAPHVLEHLALFIMSKVPKDYYPGNK
jgi:hypothetical protein